MMIANLCAELYLNLHFFFSDMKVLLEKQDQHKLG